jgi:ABC-type bacteriocin/lantibiotic exporter with double-glycine peptidase domain
VRRNGSSAPHTEGTFVSMLTAEADNVGLFVGGAITTPLLEFGTLASVLTYITLSEPLLGLLILALTLPQGAIVATIQKPVNGLVKRRLELLRTIADRAVGDRRSQLEDELHEVFDELLRTRRRTHLLKLSSKAALNTLAALGVVGVLILGGWLVLRGKTDVGTVVAALSALNRMSRPWNNLIKFYRELSAIRVRFGLLSSAIE